MKIVTKEKFILKENFKGFIETKVYLIQIVPEEKSWYLSLQDTCFDMVLKRIFNSDTNQEEEVIMREDYAYIQRPGKKFSNEEIDNIAKLVNINRQSFSSEVEYIYSVFQKGLLLITQQECNKGILETGKGLYGTTAETWMEYKD